MERLLQLVKLPDNKNLYYECRHEEQESEWLDEVESMKLELSHANDLVSSFQKKSGEVLLLSPAAAKASALLKSGMSLTQIYSKYVEV